MHGRKQPLSLVREERNINRKKKIKLWAEKRKDEEELITVHGGGVEFKRENTLERGGGGAYFCFLK